MLEPPADLQTARDLTFLSLSLSLSSLSHSKHCSNTHRLLVKRSMLSLRSTYYYCYYHTSLLQSLDKTLIFWDIVRCMSWSVKNLSLVSRWRASWHSLVVFFFLAWFPVPWCWPTKFPPYLDSSLSISLLSMEQNIIRTYMNCMISFKTMHGTKRQSPSKLWSNAQNDKTSPCVCMRYYSHGFGLSFNSHIIYISSVCVFVFQNMRPKNLLV